MWVCRTKYIWDPSDSKLLFAELSCDKSVMEGGAPANFAGGASIHADETAQKPLAHLGFKQGYACYRLGLYWDSKYCARECWVPEMGCVCVVGERGNDAR